MSSLGTKRLHAELAEIQKMQKKALRDGSRLDFVAGPVGDDLFVWHFIIKGPRDTAWEGGIFHGKLVFPSEYPNAPPDMYFTTPTGRFEINKRLCLTFTSYHPEQWTTAWSISSILTSVIAFMPTKAEGAVGGLDSTDAERRKYAIASRSQTTCQECGLTLEPDPLPSETKEENTQNTEKEENGEKEEKSETEEKEEKPEPEVKVDPEEEKRRKQERMNQAILQFMNDVKRQTAEDEQEPEPKEEKEGKIEENIAEEEIAEKNDHEGNEEPPPPLQQEEPQHLQEENIQQNQEEEPLENGAIDFKALQEGKLKTTTTFYPLLDIPIIIVFLLLCFLVVNSYAGFVNLFI